MERSQQELCPGLEQAPHRVAGGAHACWRRALAVAAKKPKSLTSPTSPATIHVSFLEASRISGPPLLPRRACWRRCLHDLAGLRCGLGARLARSLIPGGMGAPRGRTAAMGSPLHTLQCSLQGQQAPSTRPPRLPSPCRPANRVLSSRAARDGGRRGDDHPRRELAVHWQGESRLQRAAALLVLGSLFSSPSFT